MLNCCIAEKEGFTSLDVMWKGRDENPSQKKHQNFDNNV